MENQYSDVWDGGKASFSIKGWHISSSLRDCGEEGRKLV